MAFCFCLLLIATQAMAQFHWPLCENMADGMQKPECAKALDMWVKDRNGINGVDVSDQDWPECDSDTCGYKSLQCKMGSYVNIKYCRCVNPQDNTNLKLYRRDLDKYPLDITYKNFPILFKMEKFTCDWFLRSADDYPRPGVFWRPYPVPLRLGMLCDQNFTKNKYCINKYTGRCQVFPSNCSKNQGDDDQKRCSCETDKNRCTHRKCPSFERSLLNHYRNRKPRNIRESIHNYSTKN
jgi:hypothetical protein